MKHSILVAVLYLWALPTPAATYFISPTGNDSNAGTSAATSWASPKHSLNCGDVIIAGPGNYSASNFYTGKWGTVTCAAGNNVAWLKCATFDTCKISANTIQGMYVDTSYWGVQGWEVTTSSYTYGVCFNVTPKSGNIHHIIFANDVANGCTGGGFSATNKSASASVDYIVYVGNIAYNTAQASGECTSGFNIFQPLASDTAAGTHMYIAGNFAYDNHDANPCAGTKPTDGEGIIFDTFDFSYGGGPAYTQQSVAENNILVGNGGKGILVNNNNKEGSQATFYIQNNTTQGNNDDPIQQFCQGNGEITITSAYNVQVINNLTQTSSAKGCSGYPIYALSVSQGNATDVVNNNFAYGLSGNNTFLYSSGSFAYGAGNITGISPSFANPTIPSAPFCGGTANVPACMETLIANFTPLTPGALSYGYQQPGTEQVNDPLFPQWLCGVNLPPGLVTMGCFRLHLSASVS
jgi:hypothetical protein